MQLENNLATTTGWEIHEDTFVPDQAVTTGSTYMIGNGYLGYRGTFADERAEHYVGCVVTDTYDNADGTWKELVTAPNGLFTELKVDGERWSWRAAAQGTYTRSLSFRYGEWRTRVEDPASGLLVEEERLSSYADLHLLTSRTRITATRALRLEIRTGIDGAVWSLNGDHFASMETRQAEERLEIACVTGETGCHVIVQEHARVTLEDEVEVAPGQVELDAREAVRVFALDLEAGQTITVTRYVSIYTSNDLRDATVVTSDARRGPSPDRGRVQAAAAGTLVAARKREWTDLRAEHREVWDRRWKDLDIQIDGDLTAQTVLRYNMYHNVIATPEHVDYLPVGARGLSCQAYQGAAFWDQEIFNLPMFLYTRPETARNILVYRYRTLDGARRKARDLGYQGAFYAWVSGDTGDEICPSYFFKDVLSGRPIRNHFNDWQIHVAPDVAYTLWKYVHVTGDEGFLQQYGAEMLFEITRFLVSRVHFRLDLERYEVIRVLGPDEYHENVDNNFFTNFQVRFVCRYANEVFLWLRAHAPDVLERLRGEIGLQEAEITIWQDVARRIFVPEPDPETGLIEQFAGFFALEDTTPETVKARLLDPGEYWGWPNGIAVATQVSKQADVTQLFVLHPEAYDREVVRANWEYYEPRTQHGSSLSYAVYAMCAAWIGHVDEAYRYFLRSCTVDLYNTGKAVSGGTFIGGIHTAACGVAWQIVVQGFLGMQPGPSGFAFDPHLPPDWQSLTVPLGRRGARILVTAGGGTRRGDLHVCADDTNETTIEIARGDRRVVLSPGEEVRFPGAS